MLLSVTKPGLNIGSLKLIEQNMISTCEWSEPKHYLILFYISVNVVEVLYYGGIQSACLARSKSLFQCSSAMSGMSVGWCNSVIGNANGYL